MMTAYYDRLLFSNVNVNKSLANSTSPC